MFSPQKVIIPTEGLSFGSKPPVAYRISLQMYEDLVGTNLNFVLGSIGTLPFSTSIESNTVTPVLTLTFDQPIASIILGQEYKITINGTQNVLTIVFVYSDTYRSSDWRMSDPEDTAGNAFAFKEVQHGTQIISQIFNTKLKMLFEFLDSVNFRLSDFLAKMETKKRMKDIIDASVYGTGFPKDCLATVKRESDGRVSTVDLRYKESDERYTRITYIYDNGNVSYAFTDPSLSSPTVARPFLSQILIDRIADGTDNARRRYKICTIQFVRTPITYTTLFGCSVTMPAISGWEVIE